MKRVFSTQLILIAILAALTIKPIITEAQPQRRQIIIERANLMRNLKKDGIEIRRLIGDVVILHDDITMKCDSAYEYIGSNRFDAFGNVIIIQENSRLYGDTLRYNGNSKTGRVRGEIVRLVEDDATLITRYLDFDTQNNSALFYNGGIITSADARFSSERGTYLSRGKRFTFTGDVAYLDPDILLNTDSLVYYSDQEMIYFFGPTRIYNKDNYIYCEKGWHSRESDESEFLINTFIDNGKQLLFGDRVFSSNSTGYSKITGNGCIIDSAKNFTIYGGSIIYDDDQEYAEVTANPLAISVSDEGDSLFLRADILYAKTIEDTTRVDTTYQLLQGIGNVKFFRMDFQGICDSMVYHSVDSTLNMFKYPVLWNEDNQLTANHINMIFRNELIHRMEFFGSSFICSQEDSSRFNQIKGRDMVGHFAKGKLSRFDVDGNGETVYFARDKGKITAVNRAEASWLSINIKDNRVVSILFREQPVSTLFPINKAQPEDITIRGFSWQIEKRPTKAMVIPEGLNLQYYKPIQSKANLYRAKRNYPAESLNSAGHKE